MVITSNNWTRIIISLWITWFTLVFRAHWLPTSYWYEVRAVHVADAVYGNKHEMGVDRTIRRPFFAKWTVTIRRLVHVDELTGARVYTAVTDDEGRLSCHTVSSNDYSPDNPMPPNATLRGWWMDGIKGCVLAPGTYIVDTHWLLIVDGATRSVRARSNEFRVLEP